MEERRERGPCVLIPRADLDGLACGGHGLGKLAPVRMEVRDRDAGDDQVRVQLQRLQRLLVGLLIPTRCLQIGVEVHPRPHFQRILSDGALGERNRPRAFTFQEQEAAVDRPCQRVAGLARHRSVEETFGGVKVQVVLGGESPQQRMRLGERGIDAERAPGRRPGRGYGLVRRRTPEVKLAQPVITQPHMGQRERRVELDGRLEAGFGQVPRFGCHLGLMVPGPQIRFVGRQRRHVARWRLTRQPDTERLGNGLRDVVLEGEDIAHLPVVPLAPHVPAIRGRDQLGRDADASTRPPHAAFEHVRDVERLGNPPHVLVFAAECERRRSCDHLEPGRLCQQVDDLFGEAIAEVVLVLVRTHVGERKHGDRTRRGHAA